LERNESGQMTRKSFYILSFGFEFSTLIFAFSFKTLTSDPWPLTPVLSTTVECALQIHPFLTNKANFQKSQVSLSNLSTRDYEQMDTWSIGKNKAKTKPIQSQYKANTKPIQSQTNPISEAKFQNHRFFSTHFGLKAQTIKQRPSHRWPRRPVKVVLG